MKVTQVFLLLFLISTYAFPFQTKKSSTSFELGSLAFENQKWAEAQSYFDQWIQTHPADQEALWLRGQSRYVSQSLEAAIADFTVTISLDPEFASGFYHRGITYQRMGKLSEACPDLLKAKNLGMEEAGRAWEKVCK